MKAIVILTITLLILTSCRKEFECHCFGPLGDYKVYYIKGNRYQASKKCKEYTEEEHRLKGNDVGCTTK